MTSELPSPSLSPAWTGRTDGDTPEHLRWHQVVRTADGRIDIPRIQPIARLGYFDYTVVRETFEMRVPGADGDAQAGLEGRA